MRTDYDDRYLVPPDPFIDTLERVCYGCNVIMDQSEGDARTTDQGERWVCHECWASWVALRKRAAATQKLFGHVRKELP